MHQRMIMAIGNSLGVTIPADYLHRMGWKRADTISITIGASDCIILRQTPDHPNPRKVRKT